MKMERINEELNEGREKTNTIRSDISLKSSLAFLCSVLYVIVFLLSFCFRLTPSSTWFNPSLTMLAGVGVFLLAGYGLGGILGKYFSLEGSVGFLVGDFLRKSLARVSIGLAIVLLVVLVMTGLGNIIYAGFLLLPILFLLVSAVIIFGISIGLLYYCKSIKSFIVSFVGVVVILAIILFAKIQINPATIMCDAVDINCIARIAIERNNASFCDSSSNESECYRQVFDKSKSSLICQSIKNASYLDKCICSTTGSCKSR